MVFDSPANSFRLSGHKFSTVVPRHVTGDDVVHELTDIDLVMKLHYLRVVYYFSNGDAAEGLGIMELKAPMFPWLDTYYPVTGRIRRGEGVRPYIKCNDAGVRIIEVSCGYELDEWLALEDHGRHWLLVSDKTLGPELSFSPALFIQLKNSWNWNCIVRIFLSQNLLSLQQENEPKLYHRGHRSPNGHPFCRR